MTRFFRGTTGNDVIDGQGYDRDIFSDIGAGRDTVTGGANSDIFHMTVDKEVDHVDGGAGRDQIINSTSISRPAMCVPTSAMAPQQIGKRSPR